MRVLQMIDSLNWGGAQKMQVFLAESLGPLGIQLALANLWQESNSSVPNDLKRLGVEVQTFHFRRLFSPASFLNLVKYIIKSRPDLIHCHLSNANIIGTLAGRLTGVPVIASLRSSGVDRRYQRPARVFAENQIVGRGANLIMGNGWAVGEFARQRYGREDIDVIPNAIDPVLPLDQEERKWLRTGMVGNPDRLIILSVGRLSSLKGFPELINAFAELHKTHPQCALAIAGDGDQRELLDSQIIQLGLSGHVFLLGVRNDVPCIMRAADVYVNSSNIEGLPVTLLEAMAAGLPVVAARVGDIPNVITTETGILVEPHHPEQITQALAHLVEHPELQQALGNAAYQHIEKDFTRRTWTIKILKMYSKLTPAALPYLEAVERG